MHKRSMGYSRLLTIKKISLAMEDIQHSYFVNTKDSKYVKLGF